MSSSVPPNLAVRANQITFGDGSILLSAKQNYNDLRLRKKLRTDGNSYFARDVVIDGNLTIGGSIISQETGEIGTTYVDNQTGWGLEEWSFSGATYNKNVDSLIIKIYNIETNYATIAFVNSTIQNTSSKYLVAHDSNTFPQWGNPEVNYAQPCTALSGQSDLIIRSSGGVVQNLRIQNADTAVGKFLVCVDTDGRVAWQNFSGTLTVPTTISTDLGMTETASFTIYDNTNGRYIKNLLNTPANVINAAVPINSVCLLLGQDVYQAPTTAIAVKGHGNEAIVMKPTVDVSNPSGYTKVSGGSVSTNDQYIELNTNGIDIVPKIGKSTKVKLPYSSTSPSYFEIIGAVQPMNDNGVFKVEKTDEVNLTNTLMFNPYSLAGGYNPITYFKDNQLVFFNNSNSSTAARMVICPASEFAEGIELSASISSRENVLNNDHSGFTRISGSTLTSMPSGVPWTYIMCDRNGITFKCMPTATEGAHSRPATRVVTYGPHLILNRNGATLNDETTTFVSGLLQVGELSSPVQSSFNGQVNVNDVLVYNFGGRTNGDVLTCTNSSTGQVEWRTPTATVPSTVSNDVTFLANLSINNVMKTQLNASGGVTKQNSMDVVVTQTDIFTGLSFGSNDQLNNFDPEVVYYSSMANFYNVGNVTVPPNYDARITVNFPFNLTHKWCFRGDDDGQGENWCKFYYYVDKIEFHIMSNGVVEYIGNHQCSSLHSSNELGYFYFKYVRQNGGPNDDKHTMTQQFTLSNPHFDFSPSLSNVSKTYSFHVKFYWSFHYNENGGSGNRINSYWGNNEPSHYFNDWQVVLNQSFDTYFFSITYDNADQTFSSSHDNQWTDKEWQTPTYDILNHFSWGDYYGSLPWGTKSYLSKQQIYTDSKLICGLGQFGQLYLSGSLESTGFIQCRGFVGRAGIGFTNSNTSVIYSSIPSTQGLTPNNYMNLFWTGSKVETWVDATKILSHSPNVSDYRLKSKLTDMDNVLDSVMATHIYQYQIDYECYHSTNKTGVIAHELQDNFTCCPNLVTGTKDAVDREGKIDPQTIDYNELTIILMKAIQELKKENNTLMIEIQRIKNILEIN